MVIAGSLIVLSNGITFILLSDSDSLDSEYLARFVSLSSLSERRFLQVFFITGLVLLFEVPGGPCDSWLCRKSTPESCESGCEDMLEYWDSGCDERLETIPVSRLCLRRGLGGKKFFRTWNENMPRLKW